MLFTISKISSISMKTQRSEFIAFLYPAETVDAARELFSRHNTEYQNATHNCYAYIIGPKQEWQYYSDQGEPSGTAGKPILNMLLKHNMTNVLAVVTRYYGGVKLGVRGLIDAYSGAVDDVINQAKPVEYVSKADIRIVCDYVSLDSLRHFLHQQGAELVVSEYSSKISATVIYPVERENIVLNQISDLTIKGHIEILNS